MLHIVDDEEIIRDSLTWLAQSRAIAATAYASGAALLSAMEQADAIDTQGECILLDVRMPELSGAVHNRLQALSSREREVLDLILDGKMNKSIVPIFSTK
eukprot:gene18957-19296_t